MLLNINQCLKIYNFWKKQHFGKIICSKRFLLSFPAMGNRLLIVSLPIYLFFQFMSSTTKVKKSTVLNSPVSARDAIQIKGARVHNLKNISVDFPRNKFIVVTGVSGSGKSSLTIDTLFAEGQRRYAESLSAYARQFMARMDKPDVDYIKGLCPAIAIEQKVTTRTPRSTVGSMTELYDYLRLLYARVGITFSPSFRKRGQEARRAGCDRGYAGPACG